jgi:sugar phosphate isomerase/epimerase
MKKKTLSVGIDNYGLYPLQLEPAKVLEWAKFNGADGVQFSGLYSDHRELLEYGYLKFMGRYAEECGLYVEWGGGQHIPFDTETWQKRDIMTVNRAAAEQAAVLGASIVRSCSGGLMRWRPDSPMTETLLQESAAALKAQRQMLQDHGVTLAIETHFEFTSHELLRLFDMCGAEPGGYLGVCLDTMNLLTMLEDPLRASERLLPWVVCTHIKDGGILLNDRGLVSHTAPIGEGVIDLAAILRRLSGLDRQINLSIEDHGGSFDIPIFDPLFLAKFPDLTAGELAALIRMAHHSAAAADRNRRGILEREEWPTVCESRLRRDIKNLKKIVESIQRGPF